MMGVIALTMFSDDYLVVDMIEAGANGYLIKNTSREELLEAVHIAAKGGYYFCNNTTFRLSKLIARSKTNPFKPGNGLTTKEIDIIKLICQQYASKEIAPMTHLTEGSVEAARHTIMEKTGAKNVVGIVIYAIQHGIYKIP
jgi:DNA-binding NarL/FixJ family response regulator